MTMTVSFESKSRHPLSGLESWPRTGPIYGVAEDDIPVRSKSFWQRLGDRLGGFSDEAEAKSTNTRIWY